MSQEQLRKRELWIDLVKILGILMVMFNHLDIRIPYISKFGGMFYVPVFFVLAGYTMHPVKEDYLHFVKRKAQRLILPYLGYSAFLFLFFLWKDGYRANSLLGILYARNSLYPMGTEGNRIFMDITNSPMWFLPALFLTELLFEVLRRGKERFFWVSICCCTILGLFVVRLCPILLPWSLECIPVFAGLMAAGYGLKHRNIMEIYSGRAWLWLLLGGMLWLLYRLNGPVNSSVADFGAYETLGFFMMVLSSVLIMLICFQLCRKAKNLSVKPRKMMEALADSTLDMMCLHMFLFMLWQGAIGVLLPSVWKVWESGGIPAVIFRLFMVVWTMAVIAIGRYCFKRCRSARYAKKSN